MPQRKIRRKDELSKTVRKGRSVGRHQLLFKKRSGGAYSANNRGQWHFEPESQTTTPGGKEIERGEKCQERLGDGEE